MSSFDLLSVREYVFVMCKCSIALPLAMLLITPVLFHHKPNIFSRLFVADFHHYIPLSTFSFEIEKLRIESKFYS